MDRYTSMRDALNSTGRPILYSLCEWGVADPWLWGGDVGNSWRTTLDISPTWDSMITNLDNTVGLARFAGPGGFNDPDMLEVGGVGGWGAGGCVGLRGGWGVAWETRARTSAHRATRQDLGFEGMGLPPRAARPLCAVAECPPPSLPPCPPAQVGVGSPLSLPEQRAHCALWAVLKSPLLIGADLSVIPPESLAILKNKELIDGGREWWVGWRVWCVGGCAGWAGCGGRACMRGVGAFQCPP